MYIIEEYLTAVTSRQFFADLAVNQLLHKDVPTRQQTEQCCVCSIKVDTQVRACRNILQGIRNPQIHKDCGAILAKAPPPSTL